MPVADRARELVEAVDAFIAREVARNGGSTEARKPSHRVKFHWPPHPVSYSYHVLASDWKGRASFDAHGETFPLEVATTPFGVFGRCETIWLEARGDTIDGMIADMKRAAAPFFQRQFAIGRSLESPSRFTGHISELSPSDLLKLLYCEDRDVANDAMIAIETHEDERIFAPALIFTLKDRRHPNRRSAQWCALDLFEDLPSFCPEESDQRAAAAAMRDLLWDAPDDFARTVYKAGVVLGGHVPQRVGEPVLLECLAAPSRIGRRSAIHGLFHVVEWTPSTRQRIVAALREAAGREPDAQLEEFARLMARDIEKDAYDHIPEPIFPEEV